VQELVAEVDPSAAFGVFERRLRQFAVAVDELAARPADLEVDAVDVVRAQDVARACRAAR
jgi:hypothetical protein